MRRLTAALALGAPAALPLIADPEPWMGLGWGAGALGLALAGGRWRRGVLPLTVLATLAWTLPVTAEKLLPATVIILVLSCAQLPGRRWTRAVVLLSMGAMAALGWLELMVALPVPVAVAIAVADARGSRFAATGMRALLLLVALLQLPSGGSGLAVMLLLSALISLPGGGSWARALCFFMQLGLAWAALRVSGPLAGAATTVDALALGAVAVGAVALSEWPGLAGGWRDLLRLLSFVLPVMGLLWGLPELAPATLAPLGAAFLARHVVWSHRWDLLFGLVLVDAAIAWQLWEHVEISPLLVAGPLGLSLLLAAQRLRGRNSASVVAGLRYLGAGTVYLAALGDALADPARAALLATLGVLGMAAGGLLRVRAFLLLGGGAVLASAVLLLVRFGLQDGRLWALYLTALGLLVLMVMVVRTVHGPAVRELGQRLRLRLGAWEA